MKKIIALILVMLLCAAPAMAAEWLEGRSPEQPYIGAAAANLEEQIGYMMFYPNEEMQLQGGGRTLYVYLPREDVQAGEGSLRHNRHRRERALRQCYAAKGCNLGTAVLFV